jgi:CDGSH-type Zn-finger protein
MEAAKVPCGCGRSLTGFCDGSHALNTEAYLKKVAESKEVLTEKVLLNESK